MTQPPELAFFWPPVRDARSITSPGRVTTLATTPGVNTTLGPARQPHNVELATRAQAYRSR